MRRKKGLMKEDSLATGFERCIRDSISAMEAIDHSKREKK